MASHTRISCLFVITLVLPRRGVRVSEADDIESSDSFGTFENLNNLGENGALMDMDFRYFTMQCSHNTYTLGDQLYRNVLGKSRVVTHHSMFIALSLGYRCIEIDVWPRRNPKKPHQVSSGYWKGPSGQVVSVSRMKVTHHTAGIDLVNSVDLSLFIKEILTWLEEDEFSNPANATNPKLPLVISIENHAGSKSDEDYLFAVFRWLDFKLDKMSSSGKRIVPPSEFLQSTSLRSLAAFGGDGGSLRKIILKSKIKYHDSSLFHTIIAMKPFEPTDEEHLGSHSVEMSKLFTKKAIEEVHGFVSRGALVRTYPSNVNTASANYDPTPALASHAQMICINLQGLCSSSDQVCNTPVRGRLGGCPCNREYAASLELLFFRHGYDGYIYLGPLNHTAVAVQNWDFNTTED